MLKIISLFFFVFIAYAFSITANFKSERVFHLPTSVIGVSASVILIPTHVIVVPIDVTDVSAYVIDKSESVIVVPTDVTDVSAYVIGKSESVFHLPARVIVVPIGVTDVSFSVMGILMTQFLNQMPKISLLPTKFINVSLYPLICLYANTIFRSCTHRYRKQTFTYYY